MKGNNIYDIIIRELIKWQEPTFDYWLKLYLLIFNSQNVSNIIDKAFQKC